MIETKENKERWENFFVIKLYIFIKILNYKKCRSCWYVILYAQARSLLKSWVCFDKQLSNYSRALLRWLFKMYCML